jgi:hypothetical protein
LHRIRLGGLGPLADEDVIVGDRRPHSEIGRQGLPGIVVEWHRPVFVALAAPDSQAPLALGEGQVRQAQVAQLADPQPGVAQGEQDGQVALVSILLGGAQQPVNSRLARAFGVRGVPGTPLTPSVGSARARPVALAQAKKRRSAASRRLTMAGAWRSTVRRWAR